MQAISRANHCSRRVTLLQAAAAAAAHVLEGGLYPIACHLLEAVGCTEHDLIYR